MANTFPPSREAELVTWSANFSAKITAAPTTYGLTAPQATAYAALNTAFANAYAVAQADATRSPMNIATKNVAKTNLLADIRLLGGIVQAFPGTTNPMRIDLGLPERNLEPTPIPVPNEAPDIDFVSVIGRTVRIRLHEAGTATKRGKPDGVAGASIFTFVGATAPASLSEWEFEGNTTRTIIDIEFADTVPAGALVWVTAFWFNPRTQSGPASTAKGINIAGGSVSQAA